MHDVSLNCAAFGPSPLFQSNTDQVSVLISSQWWSLHEHSGEDPSA